MSEPLLHLAGSSQSGKHTSRNRISSAWWRSERDSTAVPSATNRQRSDCLPNQTRLHIRPRGAGHTLTPPPSLFASRETREANYDNRPPLPQDMLTVEKRGGKKRRSSSCSKQAANCKSKSFYHGSITGTMQGASADLHDIKNKQKKNSKIALGMMNRHSFL